MSRWMRCLQSFILLARLFTVIKLNFLEDQLLILGNLQAKELKVEIEVAHWITRWLIVLKMQAFHIRMCKGLINRDSAFRIECKHLFNQVYSIFVRASKKFREVLATIAGQLSHEGPIVIIFDLIN